MIRMSEAVEMLTIVTTFVAFSTDEEGSSTDQYSSSQIESVKLFFSSP